MLEVAHSPLAGSAEAEFPPSSNLRLSRFFKSRLAWRVAFAVWLSIVVVEAVILLTSVNSYRQQLLDQLDRIGIAAVKAALPVHLRGESPNLGLVDEVLARQSAIRGAALYSGGGRLIGRLGEPPRASPQDFAARSAHMIAPAGQDRRETFWAAADTGLPYDVVLRLDSSWLQSEVAAFARRVMGLTLVISVAAAAITFWTLSRVMLLPLLQLHDTLDAARNDPSRPALYQLPVDRSDELGDVVAVFNAMLRRTAVNLETLQRQREALSGANQELEQRVAERTTALTATNQSLEQEIAERRRAEARLEHLATHDPLTGLPNRALFRDRLEQALTQARRQRQMVAILVFDLDRFKEVNDVFGHAAGDALLKQVAARLLAVVRETDTVARLGGDEFAIVQVGLAQPSGAHALAVRLVGAMTQSYRFDGQEVDVGVAIGIAVAPVDGEQGDPLLIHADAALRRAKADGRGAFRFFEPAMDEELKRRRALERDLRNALIEDQFELVYQPRINLETGAVAGFEALLRWRHPARGVVTPDDFIEVAEDTGLIDAIGAWVIRHACSEASAWPAPPGVSVNLSPAQFRQRNVIETVTAALEESKLEPERLEVEITESTLLRDTEEILATLRELRRLGVRVAMDDFGTGYSSLSYLRRFPFDHIKIDRSFVVGLDRDPGARAIIRAVVSLGRGLGMQTTAEGVETEAQLALLRAEGCTDVQGFLFSGPVPGPDVPRVIETARAGVSEGLASQCS